MIDPLILRFLPFLRPYYEEEQEPEKEGLFTSMMRLLREGGGKPFPSPSRSYSAPPIQASRPTAPITVQSTGYGGQMGGNPRDFVQWLKPYADQVEAQTGIPSLAMLAIAANETGWGNPKYIVGNNLFGIKGEGPAGSYLTPTWEDYGQGRVDIVDRFRSYPSTESSFADFAKFMEENSRYAGYQNYRDPQAFINFIKSKNYATDPAWTQKLASIMRTIQQQQ